MAEKKPLTVESSAADFKRAYQAKRALIERQREDFLFALGEQWTADEKRQLESAGLKPFVDNRIQPNLFLLTGLERQNRVDLKAYPIGEEDGIKAEIATALFKDAARKSEFQHKSSEQFKDGATCGESHLELYLDFTDSLINGTPKWRKCDSSMVFPEPSFREYDMSDSPWLYKVTLDIKPEDLINMYPEKRALIEEAGHGRLDNKNLMDAEGTHLQRRDYPTEGGSDIGGRSEAGFDLIERFHKKYVDRYFIADKQTGEVTDAAGEEEAQAFVQQYKEGLAADQQTYESSVLSTLMEAEADPELGQLEPTLRQEALNARGMLPPPPEQRDPERFIVIKRLVPEIWCFAHVPGINEPLADERAWFYPRWKSWPIIPYFARFSTAPLTGDDRHLLIQGVVHSVKDAQRKHNRAEILMLRHLNSSANSGWIAEEGVWVDPAKVQQFGSAPGINLEYKQGRQKPERITPAPLSEAHAAIALESAEAIKAQLGMNSDLLAAQEGAQGDSGRAIALRQKQGLLMVQEMFDNLTRTRTLCGRMTLALLPEMYDTQAAMKVLGEAFLAKNFPPLMMVDPDTGEEVPAPDPENPEQPQLYDKQRAEVAIAEVLSGQLETYDVSVGEAVASETGRMATAAELKELSAAVPVPPDVLVKYSTLPESAKAEILSALQQAMLAAQQQEVGGQKPLAKKQEGKRGATAEE